MQSPAPPPRDLRTSRALPGIATVGGMRIDSSFFKEGRGRAGIPLTTDGAGVFTFAGLHLLQGPGDVFLRYLSPKDAGNAFEHFAGHEDLHRGVFRFFKALLHDL